MSRILKYVVIVLTLVTILIFIAGYLFNFTVENYLHATGYLFVSASAILVYFQIRINLRYSKRKSAIEFCNTQIKNELFPLVRSLTPLLGKRLVEYYNQDSLSDLLKGNKLGEQTKSDVKKIVLDTLNFYERMSIGILKEIYDEDICYDDNGYNLIQFYIWTKTFIDNLRIEHQEERLFINFEEIAERWKAYYLRTKEKHTSHNARVRSKKTIRDKSI